MQSNSRRQRILRGGILVSLILLAAGTAMGQQGIFVNLANEPSRIPDFLGEGRGIAVGDVDGDNDLDIFVGTDEGNARDRLLINDGSGRFEDDTTRRMPPKSGFAFTEDVDFVDLENDGDLDLLIAQARPDGGDQNLAFVNDGRGFFANETLLRLPGGPTGPMDRTYGIATGDVNGDGFADAYIANGFSTPDFLLVNDGTGKFRDNSSALPISAKSLNSISPEFVDVDGDGDLDLWIGTGGTAEFVPHIFINDGLGRFDDQTQFRLSTEISANAYSSRFADFDGDGDQDVVFCNTPGRARLMINNGFGFFRDETTLRLPFDAAACHGLATGDYDADGDPDIALGRNPDDSLLRSNLLLINSDGLGHFIATPLTADGGGFSAAFFDADEDNDLDLIFLNKQEHQLWINRQ